jgi:hypothetical protein
MDEMNCKQGDLAIVVYAKRYPQFLGRVVRIGKACEVFEKCWDTEPPTFSSPDAEHSFCDEHLKRINDQDGEDEMLRIAGKPIDLGVPA